MKKEPMAHKQTTYKTISFLIIIHLVVMLTLSGCSTNRSAEESLDFRQFTESCFKDLVSRDSLSLHFKLSDPSGFDLDEIPASFGDISISSLKEECNHAGELLNLLHSYDRKHLSEDDQLTFDIMERKLNQTVQSGDYLLYQSLLGTNGLPSQIPVSLSEYYFNNENDIKNYLALMSHIPELFGQVIEYEQLRNKEGFYIPSFTRDNTIDQIDRFLEGSKEDQLLLSTFEDRINSVSDLSEDQKKTYISNNQALFEQVVIPAYRSLKDTLTAWEITGQAKERLCQYDKGRKYYQALLTANTGTDKSPDECITFLEKQLGSIIKETASLNASQPELYTDYLASQPALSDPDDILEQLKSAVSDDFPSLEEIPYSLKELPSSLSGTSAAAFYLIPPIDIRDTNIIYLNNTRLGDKELFSTLAHEGYPGHLYQTNYYMSQNPDPLRYLIKTGGYDEGWGTYAQLYSYNFMEFKNEDQETADALRILYRNNDLLSLTLSSLSDLYVNYRDYDRDALADYLAPYGIKKDSVSAIYEYVAENPTTYLTYCMGYYELDALKKDCAARLGEEFSLLKFHKKVLDCGSCPFDLLKKRVESQL